MTPERWQEVKKLLAGAMERKPEQRRVYLDQACADPDLRREVETLITAHEQGDSSFMDQPAGHVGPLPSGTKLGSYTITALIGAGGMGEVYRAHDTKLRRDVAIKVLPLAFIDDPERLARFQREARLLASLNYPNIASIYGLEDSDNAHALVMELVEGPTLADRIHQGSIPIEEALPIAKQIAEALEYAHEHGVIHRDLKPANVKVASDDTVKILDFGLAKALESGPSADDIANSPTLSQMATQAGVLLGTAAYMPPEQAKGKPIDRRTDIWAFGCVLYEMLAGKKAFGGETVAETLAAVLQNDPDWTQLPAATPPHVRVLLRRCLQKNVRQRLQAIGDARIALAEATSGSPESGMPTVAAPKWRRAVPWVAGALLGATVASLIVWRVLSSQTRPRHAISTSILAPAGSSFRFMGFRSGFALSPDGQRLAFIAANGQGKTALWVRPLDSSSAQLLQGTEGASSPFWSPDSSTIGFFSGDKLKKVNASGGSVGVICDVSKFTARGGTWNRDGDILFGSHWGAPIYRVSAAGGTPVAVTRLNPTRKERAHQWPHFLPDGRHFLYLAGDPYAPPESGINGIFVASLDSKKTKFLVKANSGAVYASGYLLFLQRHTLMAQRFDPQRLEVEGDAFPLRDGVLFDAFRLKGQFSVSNNGLMAYASSSRGTGLKLEWFDRSGKRLGAVPDKDAYCCPQLSPSGNEVVYDSLSGGRVVRVYDAVRGTKVRLTFGVQNPGTSAWSPDGRHIIYSSNRNGLFGLYEKAADGSGTEKTVLPPSAGAKFPWSWSPGGKYLSYLLMSRAAGAHLWILPVVGGKPFRFIQSDLSGENQAGFSPDGKWLAYTATNVFASNGTGQPQIYAAAFPGPGSRYQVSTNGGYSVRWGRDGKDIYYVTLDDKLMAAPVTEAGNSLEIGTPQQLFEIDDYSLPPIFDVTPDGRRFIATTFDDQANRSINLVVPWPALLERK